jgi:hypothetical protein
MQKEKSDTAKAAVGMPMAAHTPMMQQYRRVTYWLNIFIGNVTPRSVKSHCQSSHGPHERRCE